MMDLFYKNLTKGLLLPIVHAEGPSDINMTAVILGFGPTLSKLPLHDIVTVYYDYTRLLVFCAEKLSIW